MGKPPSAGLSFIVDKPDGECRIMRPTILRLLALAAFFSITAPPVTHAEFIASRSEWAKMSDSEKTGYVMGVIDEYQFVYYNRKLSKELNAYGASIKTDIKQCLLDLNLTSRDLIDLVENAHKNPKNWEFPSNTVLILEVFKVCRRKVNAARALRGEEPLPE